MRWLKKGWILLACIFVLAPLAAQDYKYHAIFFYNFAKYIKWPGSYQSGDIVIGVLGDSKIIQPLEQMARTKTVNDQRFIVRKYNSPSEINRCHMLFIPFDRSGQLNAILEEVKDKPTLVITEKPGLGHQGSGINFILVNGRWQFELNRTAVEKANLKVAGELMRLAVPISN